MSIRDNENPLYRWLEMQGMSQVQFAERLSAIAGHKIYQAQVSRWVTGTSIPTRRSRELICQAAKGVHPDLWTEYAAELASRGIDDVESYGDARERAEAVTVVSRREEREAWLESEGFSRPTDDERAGNETEQAMGRE